MIEGVGRTDASTEAGLVTITPTLIPKGFRIIEGYSIREPYVRIAIVRNDETGEILYLVDEVKLTRRERSIYLRIIETLEWELKPIEETEDPYEYFRKTAVKTIHKYRIRLGNIPGVSWAKILYYAERDILGYGKIDALMKDPNLEDISCDGYGRPIYVWHRRYEYIPTNVMFEDEEELNEFVLKLAHKAGKHVSTAWPILDAMLPGMHRVAATFSKEVSTSGSTFTIRKFREDPISVIDLINFGTIDPETAAYLWIAMEYKMPTLIMGVTGSGKTTLLNALTCLFRPTLKVVTIEDIPELRLPLENWVQLVSRPSYSLGPERVGEISLFDLVKVSLRYRPDIIIVGEVRGEEAYVLFQALATGHGGLTTIHAENVEAAVRRLTSPPMNIPDGYIPLMKLGMIIRRVRIFSEDNPAGRITRRVAGVYEVKGVGSYNRVSIWDPYRDRFEKNLNDSFVLREIAETIGRSYDQLLEEVSRRSTVLRWMASKGIRSYKDVASMVHLYYADPWRVYERAVKEA
ncbi:MAG: type II/IV secretion system ATPase subunit [Candidatus Bathyarchaeia archaeon]